MNPSAILLVLGLFLNSALYFIFVFCAALASRNHQALVAVIVATGITYFSYYAQLATLTMSRWTKWVAGILVVASIAIGTYAGLLLL